MNNDLSSIIEQATDLGVPKRPPTSLSKPVEKRRNQAALALIKTSTKDHISRRALVAHACEHLEGAAGGRSALLETLKFCPETSSGHRMARRLIEDAAANDVNTALTALCTKNKIKFETLVVAFKDALSAQLAVQALAKLADKVPDVVDQIAVDATNRFDACPVCEGETRVKRIGDNGEWALTKDGEPLTQLCYNCRGTGKVFKPHDVQDRKLFLQITGILDDRRADRGPLVNINQNAVLGKDFQPGDGSFERLIKAVDVAVGRPSASEEVIEVPFVAFEEEPAQ